MQFPPSPTIHVLEEKADVWQVQVCPQWTTQMGPRYAPPSSPSGREAASHQDPEEGGGGPQPLLERGRISPHQEWKGDPMSLFLDSSLSPREEQVRRMLDVFSGTCSAATIYRQAGYEVVTVDWDPKFGADHVVDVLR